MTRLVDDLLVYARKGIAVDRTSAGRRRRARARARPRSSGRRPRPAASHLDREAPPACGWTAIATRSRQALANLLANAVRLAPAGLDDPGAGRRPGALGLDGVEDEGPGIDPEDQERVFQRFWRGDPQESRREGRSGLGLTIVRQIAEAHGGEVKLASELGHGAAFAIWLPASLAAAADEPTSPTPGRPP